MEKNQIKKGIIVVVEKELFGNDVGTITKVASKLGEVCDLVFNVTKKTTTDKPESNSVIMCEATSKPYARIEYNNKKVCFERIENLRLATELEKERYRKGIYTIYNEVYFEEVK